MISVETEEYLRSPKSSQSSNPYSKLTPKASPETTPKNTLAKTKMSAKRDTPLTHTTPLAIFSMDSVNPPIQDITLNSIRKKSSLMKRLMRLLRVYQRFCEDLNAIFDLPEVLQDEILEYSNKVDLVHKLQLDKDEILEDDIALSDMSSDYWSAHVSIES